MSNEDLDTLIQDAINQLKNNSSDIVSGALSWGTTLSHLDPPGLVERWLQDEPTHVRVHRGGPSVAGWFLGLSTSAVNTKHRPTDFAD